MKRSPAILLVLAAAFSLVTLAPRAQTSRPADHAAVDRLALTPPMGWYPWNEFGQEPQNETLIRQIADALVKSGMKDAGYTYVGPDEGICFSRGADGQLTPNLTRYPSGLRGLGDYIHGLGLKYALYTDAGTLTCSKAMPGTKGHEIEDMASFAGWRADYVKIDWCNTEGQDIVETYTALGKAQRAAGRPIVHSLCSWGDGEPWKWAAAIGHMWRTTGDICGPGRANWAEALKIASLNEKLHEAAGPGHWNDPDMMIAGMDGLTDTENRSFFSLWCMMAAPLMAGNDLRRMTDATVRVLTDLEVIAVNQDPLGVQGRIVRRDGAVEIWAAKPLVDGSRALLVFNKGNAPATVNVTWADAGFPDGSTLFVRDLWDHKTTGPHRDGIAVTVAPDGASFLRVSRINRFPIPPIIVADRHRVVLRAEGASVTTRSGTITVRNAGSDELPAWKVAPGLPAWLTVTVARTGKSQTLTNTVSTAGLATGSYHAVVRADNVEPVSGRPMSALYYDVDVEVTGRARGKTNGGNQEPE